ncbi:MAG: hypothetical protein ACI8W7_001934 [Gammaproteobacteria bacterium]|jgi:hypothetical protein
MSVAPSRNSPVRRDELRPAIAEPPNSAAKVCCDTSSFASQATTIRELAIAYPAQRLTKGHPRPCERLVGRGRRAQSNRRRTRQAYRGDNANRRDSMHLSSIQVVDGTSASCPRSAPCPRRSVHVQCMSVRRPCNITSAPLHEEMAQTAVIFGGFTVLCSRAGNIRSMGKSKPG